MACPPSDAYLRLHHVAVGGLIPVIEGASRRLAAERGLDGDGPVKDVFRNLAAFAKEDVVRRRIGATREIVSMLDSFLGFIEDYFYSKSQAYPLVDTFTRSAKTVANQFPSAISTEHVVQGVRLLAEE